MSTLDLSEYVRIVNNTGKTIKARYDGKDYIFSNGEPTDVHQLAAAHIFGFGLDDKTNAFHRLGWLVTGDYEQALERLKEIEFGEIPSVAVSISSAPKKRGRPRISGPNPREYAGADDGGEASASPPTDAGDEEEAVGDL
jgi:hypothetical protein